MKAILDSRQLQAFAAIARTGSFTRAAQKLFLSQSAISHSMKALEDEVGCRLFDRIGRTFALTQAGEHLLFHTEKILHEMETARVSLAQLGKWGQSRLRVGASITACEFILPNVLRGMKEKFPHCAIMVEPGDTPESILRLEQNRISLVLGIQPKSEGMFQFNPLFTDQLVFILAPSHPWALTQRIERQEIPKQNYILYSKQSYTSRLVQDYFARENMVLNTVIELGSMPAIKEMAKLGLGISILPAWICRKELAEGSLAALPLGPRKLKRHWGVIHRSDQRLNLPEETFIQLCRSAAGDLHMGAPDGERANREG